MHASTDLTFADFPAVDIKVHAAARRMTLRYQPHKGVFLLTTPKRTSRRAADAFIEQQRAWMLAQQALYPRVEPIAPGRTLLFMGREYTVQHEEKPGVAIHILADTLLVQCRAARFPRALLRFLKQHATDTITQLVHEKAHAIARPVQNISLRDTTSRWGSCSRDGRLSFSWRLIMAPPEVIDYVVAHEVAHLVHFDHSKDFWALCRQLSTHYTFGKHWLQQNTALLHTMI